MKKSLFLVFTVFLLLIMVACADVKNDDKILPDKEDAGKTFDSDEEIDLSGEEFSEEENEIKKILADKSDEYRFQFLSFWRSMQNYCMGIKNNLRQIKNTASYEFDPMNENQFPEELKDVIDVERIRMYNSGNLFGDFYVTIDGYDVTFSSGDMMIFPSEYNYEDIQAIIDSLQ